MLFGIVAAQALAQDVGFVLQLDYADELHEEEFLELEDASTDEEIGLRLED